MYAIKRFGLFVLSNWISLGRSPSQRVSELSYRERFSVDFGRCEMSEKSVVSIDPLLRDLNERKQSFRRNVVSLAAELKDVRGRLASKEQSFAKETLTRQARDGRCVKIFVLLGLLFVFCSGLMDLLLNLQINLNVNSLSLSLSGFLL